MATPKAKRKRYLKEEAEETEPGDGTLSIYCGVSFF